MRFAKRSSIEAPLIAAPLGVVVAAGAVLTVVGLVSGSQTLTTVGLVGVVGLGALFAVYLILAERRRHEAAEKKLATEARFLESLVESLGRIAESTDALDQTRREAERLFDSQAHLLTPSQREGRARAENTVVVPIKARDEEIGSLRLTRDTPFSRDDVVRATVLADFAAREQENARLLGEAQVREAERSRLTEQLVTAEQDERRRLANELHDGAVQSLSGIALLLDAGLNSIGEKRPDEAEEIIGRALERHRATIKQLRDLSFNLEPVVLRDQGFGPAIRALTDQIGIAHQVRVDVDVEPAETLAEQTQAALYQIIREALTQAVRRGPPGNVSVTVRRTEEGGIEATVADDAPGERRRRTLEELEERARTLNGQLRVQGSADGGTSVVVVLPPYVAAG